MEVIREARLEDISDLAQLLEILFTQEKDFVPDRDKQSRGLELIIRTPEAGRVFVAVVDDEIVGMNSLLFSISTVEGRAVCWLEDVIIRPDRRGNGLGSRLMQHAIDYAKENGFARISVIADSVQPSCKTSLSKIWISTFHRDNVEAVSLNLKCVSPTHQ